jgi:hypothetical protein
LECNDIWNFCYNGRNSIDEIDEKIPEIDIVMTIIAAILIGITFPLYRWRLKREIKKNFK